VLVLVGDTAGARPEPLAEALGMFAGFGGLKLMVPGNHCLWCPRGENSIRRYEEVLPELAGRHGFALLDHKPVQFGPVGLVGSVGWYDYSFADRSLGIPDEFYQAKVAPGAAGELTEFAGLLDRFKGRLSDRAMSIRSRWMDGRHVRLGMTDREFCRLLADRLAAQLGDLSPRVERIIAFMHHLPFAELLPEGRPDPVAFAAAYMGSPIFGQVLLACLKVTDVYCGHSHWHGRHKVGHINVVNVGSTYSSKRLEVLVV